MKKSLLALAILGAYAGVASAQSSVTLYGTVDLNARYVKNDGSNRRLSLSQDGLNSSQLGFRGIEDLGGGLKANFVLLAGVNADTGTTNAKFFNRRATLSLLGNFGEVRLGRDYVPTFWNQTIFDAFGTNGLGDSTHVAQLYSRLGTRADNTIGYFLPTNIGGVYGQFMAAAGEGGVDNPGRLLSGRVGFAAGPFDVAASYGQQRYTSGISNQKTANIGGSFDLKVVKLMGYFHRDKQGVLKENRFSVGAAVPIGQSEIHASYGRSKLTQPAGKNTVDQFALGYVYSLSKRTALYTTVSVLDNDRLSQNAVTGFPGGAPFLAVPAPSSITAYPTLGGKSKGAEVGIRHFF